MKIIKQEIVTPYYEDGTRVSNSSLKWFIEKGPKYFKARLDGEEEGDKGPQLEKGTMIHEYLLQPEEFEKDYMVCTFDRPVSTQQEAFCQAYAKSIEIEPERKLYKSYENSYSIIGKSKDKIIELADDLAKKFKDYIAYLQQPNKPILINEYQLEMLKRIKYNISNHKAANKLLVPANGETVEHEFHINWEFFTLTAHSVPCKSLLDSVTFDWENKVCTIMDLKTTAKLWHFEDSINTYDYCRQLCFYKLAVEWYIDNVLHLDPASWKFNFYIIAIDAYSNNNEVRVLHIDDYTVSKKSDVINRTIDSINYHMITGQWEHSQEYYDNEGIENIDDDKIL